MSKRVFIAFAMADEGLKNLFRGHSKNARVPYEFIDMSVKEPWDEKWKTNCRTRIRGCDGVIVLISKGLKGAQGAIWEIDCAKEEKKPTIGVYIGGTTSADAPNELLAIKKVEWTWDNVRDFIDLL